ncbi:MAG: hypothetical protein LBP93_02350 [Treponema sp.]|jgi:hypothetical protein|nr:hypothetical protein [Treponema sp.]
MNGNGKGGSNRRGYRRRERDREKDNWARDNKKKADFVPRYDKNRGLIYDRPKWTAPKLSTDPIPAPDCPYCGKPIRDLSAAFSDRSSGAAVHFDCVIARLAENEILQKGDAITYIGGGRFGIVHFNNPSDFQGRSSDPRKFTIKKIFEWEDKENRAEWRKSIADHYSLT